MTFDLTPGPNECIDCGHELPEGCVKAIRADERSKVEAEIVAWLRERAKKRGLFGNRLLAADDIEAGKHRKGKA